MLAHQIKSDCDRARARQAVDTASEAAHKEESMSSDESLLRESSEQQQHQQQLASAEDSSSASNDFSQCDGSRRLSGSDHEDTRRRQQADHTDKMTSCEPARTARPIEARLLVRRREAGALIGKRGANIKRLRQIFSESAFNIPDTGNGPERVVCINSRSLEQLALILTELTQLFQEKQASQPARNYPTPMYMLEQGGPPRTSSDLIEVKLLVNASHAGLLIGVGGQSIRKLRSDSRAAIKIYEMCCPLSSERVCAIKAKPPVVVATIKMIVDTLAANPIKGTHKPYDALNFDLFLVDKYGGYAADDELGPLVSSSPPRAPAASPLDFLQHLHQQTLPAQSALMLQNQAAQLLAAAAAAASASDRPATSCEQYNWQRSKTAPLQVARMLARSPASCERYAAAAAVAAEKYHSLIKAGQQAAIANRFHPYYAHLQARAHHQSSGASERHQSTQNQSQCHWSRRSSSHGLACPCCVDSADDRTTSTTPASSDSAPPKDSST